jgi:protein-S-isoprenylcysteine O-methyltransferase Ste14
MTSLELKIPPPIVALALGLFMWLTTFVAPSFEAPFGWRLAVALLLVFVGQGIGASGMVAFRRAKTTVNPIRAAAASSLVTSGVYRFTRNPMYFGLLLTLLAWAAYLMCPAAVFWVVAYVLYIGRFQILPEERVLLSLFGADYARYTSEVRRWL